MTTITVTAADTAQAMDKIVERLGEDALILETVKRNGRIEMIATDSVEDTEATEPASASPHPENGALSGLNIEIGGGAGFTDLFDQQMINTVRDRKTQATSTVDHLVGRDRLGIRFVPFHVFYLALSIAVGGLWLVLPEAVGVATRTSRPSRAAWMASSTVFTSLTKPALPRPPAWTCALTTTSDSPEPRMRSVSATASSTVSTIRPGGTGMPASERSCRAWYSWIFMVWRGSGGVRPEGLPRGTGRRSYPRAEAQDRPVPWCTRGCARGARAAPRAPLGRRVGTCSSGAPGCRIPS